MFTLICGRDRCEFWDAERQRVQTLWISRKCSFAGSDRASPGARSCEALAKALQGTKANRGQAPVPTTNHVLLKILDLRK